MPYPSKKFRQNPFTSFRVIRRTDRQTDRQTDRTENITSFFGGGNKLYCRARKTYRPNNVNCVFKLDLSLMVAAVCVIIYAPTRDIFLRKHKSATNSGLPEWQHGVYARDVMLARVYLSQFRLSVCVSVCHTRALYQKG